MKHIAEKLRGMQIYAHAGHNLVAGRTFSSDHEDLGELYLAFEGQYDETVEYMIGLGIKTSPLEITKVGLEMAEAEGESSDPEVLFVTILRMESDLKMEISLYLGYEKRSDGVQNFLQGLAEKSDKRVYKLQQRLS